MIIDINKTSGFCAGVRNALNKLDEVIASKEYKAIYYFEEIVHNDEVISKYIKLGLKKISLNDIDGIDKKDSLIVLSAHGSSDILKNSLSSFNVLDVTCPFVKKNQYIAKSFDNVIYIGKENHAESIATTQDLKNVIIVDSVKNLDFPIKEYLVINQTTYNMDKLEEIHKELLNKYKDIKIVNSLCPTTISNQKSVKDNSYDVLLAVGSRKSNNLNTLFELSTIKRKYIIENIKDVDNIKINNEDKILIVGSASTDPKTLEELNIYLKNL